ncbi:hypothetical protein DF185_03630 [Marinifilum breve]|uniref:Uncharacterized protein n=1 Tax=Marinifilum breve TaxID=2184082 RepID=A0A2V4A2P1_9BACT|nr:DUF3857 domain-containing protein [Marinifilum breve]PXY03185.1 hypothetical protein DF185_03630 [Marinifilum breve]
MKLIQLFWVLIFTSQSILSLATPTFKIKPSPVWKTKINFDPQGNAHKNEGSVSYLLLDWQDNEITKEYNYRYCMSLNDEDAVQSNSQLYFTFDPSYEELCINTIKIYRNGKIINKLNRDKIELMRNEKNVERYIYDGSYSAVCILEDVQVGDILEYEYTLKGANPIFKNHFYNYHSQAFSSRIQHMYYQMLLPEHKKYQVKNLFGGVAPIQSTKNGMQSISWNLKNVAPIFTDEDSPSWYDAYPASEISSFQDWKEVRSFMQDLYPMNVVCPKIKDFISKKKIRANEEGVIQIIRFVQDEIRYLAMSNGVNSHKPHHPEKVFEQRFGDCKDKSYLLSYMLKEVGVMAWPAIVNTNAKRYVDRYVPSPFAFNHVIVKINWKGKNYWVDPTFNNQKGGMDQLQNPRYGKALVIDNDKTDWEKIPENQINKVVINENFWFTDSISKIRYDVVSKFSGQIANIRRGWNLSNSLAENKDAYLDYCTRFYENMNWKHDSALIFRDNQKENTFTIIEKYEIESLWEHRGTDSLELYSSYFPYNMYEFMNSTNDKVRNAPLQITHPIDVELKINLHFPKHKQVAFEEEKDSVVNDMFKFHYDVSNNRLSNFVTLTYKYKSLQDHVPVEKLKTYYKDYNQVSEKCEYPVQWGMEVDPKFKIFGPAVFMAVLLIIGLFFWIRKLYNWDIKPEFQFGSVQDTIGGWLAFVALGLYVTPISIIYLIYDSGYFSQAIWDSFITQYGNQPFLAGGFYFFELLYNLATIFFAIFLIVLMHQKRSTFPKLYIYFRVIVLVGLFADNILGAEIIGSDAIDTKELSRGIVGAAIWIPYMMKSKRVKETFVKRLGKNKAQSEKTEELQVSKEMI